MLGATVTNVLLEPVQRLYVDGAKESRALKKRFDKDHRAYVALQGVVGHQLLVHVRELWATKSKWHFPTRLQDLKA